MKEKTQVSWKGCLKSKVSNVHTIFYCIWFMIRRYNVKLRASGDLLKLYYTRLLSWVYVVFISVWMFNHLSHREACLDLQWLTQDFESWKIHFPGNCMLYQSTVTMKIKILCIWREMWSQLLEHGSDRLAWFGLHLIKHKISTPYKLLIM